MATSFYTKKKKAPVIKWSVVRNWPNPYDPDKEVPDYRYPEWSVRDVMLNMTLSENNPRGGKSVIALIKDATESLSDEEGSCDSEEEEV